MRLSAGVGVGPIRVSQTIARSGGRRRSGNALGDLVIATIAMVAWIVYQTIRLSVVIGNSVFVFVVRSIVAGREARQVAERNRAEVEASHKQ